MSPYTSRLLTLTMKSCKSYFWYAQLAKSAYIADRNAYAQIKIEIDLLTQHILRIEMQINLLTEHTLQIALQNVLLCISYVTGFEKTRMGAARDRHNARF